MTTWELIAMILGWAYVFFFLYACYSEARRQEKKKKLQDSVQNKDHVQRGKEGTSLRTP